MTALKKKQENTKFCEFQELLSLMRICSAFICGRGKFSFLFRSKV